VSYHSQVSHKAIEVMFAVLITFILSAVLSMSFEPLNM
jgi:hypothetical protein